MKSWLVGALAGACIGVVIYLVLTQKPSPPAESRIEPRSAAPAPVAPIAPSPPVVLTEVVEVTDIDQLLDPPAKAEIGVPFDDASATWPVPAPANPAPIPRAVDGPEPAPIPHAAPDRLANGGSFHF